VKNAVHVTREVDGSGSDRGGSYGRWEADTPV